MTKFTKNQIIALERELMSHYRQPIPNSKFFFGQYLGYMLGGWSDLYEVEIFKINKTKALVKWDKDYCWVPLKHLYITKEWNLNESKNE